MTDEEKRDDAAEEPQEEAEEAKEEKSNSDWITAQVPKVSRQQAQQAKAADSEPPLETVPDAGMLKDEIESTIVEGVADSPAATMPAAGSMGAGASAPAVAAPAASTGGSSVPLGGVLENIGVSDERTQKIIVYGCGTLIALSCACSCIATAITMMSGGGFSSF